MFAIGAMGERIGRCRILSIKSLVALMTTGVAGDDAILFTARVQGTRRDFNFEGGIASDDGGVVGTHKTPNSKEKWILVCSLSYKSRKEVNFHDKYN